MTSDGRRRAARILAFLVVVGAFTPAGVSALTPSSTGTPGTVGLEPGTVERQPNGSTVVAIQGFHFRGQGAQKKPARLVSVAPNGTTEWVVDGSKSGARWFYDVDPLPNGNLLVVSTNSDGTLVFELNPETKERVWAESFDFHDTHDVDMLPNGNLLIANMRNFSDGVSNDRVLVYNRTTDETVWQWRFRNHYPNATDGGFGEDWTHVNDVDRIGEGRYLVSPRNFDQVIVIDRESGEIVHRLGEDGNHDTLFEQHNPDWLMSESGNPTILVADSENDRVVEYAKRDGEWVKTWELGTGQLAWPRDADRLPNGNTLIVDSLNHRVIEVTPQGRIVWEYYATWGPYDAERRGTGDGSSGPTMADLGVTGQYRLTNSAGLIEGTGQTSTFAATVQNTFAGTVLGPIT
ncbi:MAG: aryl-sulfate sulfotransferase, partial [Halobaculum sp.]